MIAVFPDVHFYTHDVEGKPYIAHEFGASCGVPRYEGRTEVVQKKRTGVATSRELLEQVLALICERKQLRR